MSYEVPSSKLIEPPYLVPAIALWFCISREDGDPLDGLRELLYADLDLCSKIVTAGFIKAQRAGFPIEPEQFASAANIAIGCFHQSAGEGVRMGLTASWYGYGMPALEVSHKLAASLMVTRPSRELVADTPPPFPTFLVHLPNKLLTVNSSTGGAADVRSVLVGHRTAANTEDDSRWCSCTLTDMPVTLWRVQQSFPDLVLSDTDDSLATNLFDHRLDEIDDRSQTLLHRLLANLVLYVSDQSRMEPIGRGHSSGSFKRRNNPEPVKRVFRVTSDVKHDFRQFVRDYMSGTGQKLDVQLFVEGHFKQQAHGAGRALRKRIWIQPYWRGPEDAPIAFRKHRYE